MIDTPTSREPEWPWEGYRCEACGSVVEDHNEADTVTCLWVLRDRKAQLKAEKADV